VNFRFWDHLNGLLMADLGRILPLGLCLANGRNRRNLAARTRPGEGPEATLLSISIRCDVLTADGEEGIDARQTAVVSAADTLLFNCS
jgi:hypothetical protein